LKFAHCSGQIPSEAVVASPSYRDFRPFPHPRPPLLAAKSLALLSNPRHIYALTRVSL
jgi:hypothetical protein